LHLSLDGVATTETPVVESAITIVYWDGTGRRWRSSFRSGTTSGRGRSNF
jgi:hypothetical protein